MNEIRFGADWNDDRIVVWEAGDVANASLNVTGLGAYDQMPHTAYRWTAPSTYAEIVPAYEENDYGRFTRSAPSSPTSSVPWIYLTRSKDAFATVTYTPDAVSASRVVLVWVTTSGASFNARVVARNTVTTTTYTGSDFTVSAGNVRLLPVIITTGSAGQKYDIWLEVMDTTGTRSVKILGWGVYTQGTSNVNSGSMTDYYDNITDYSLDAQWESGIRSPNERTGTDGTLSLTLDNTSKLFSPDNTLSPLYGKFAPGKLIMAQIKNASNEWQTMWAGYLDSISVTTGENGETTATITAVQQMYLSGNRALSYPVDDVVQTVLPSRSAANLMTDLVHGNGWVPPTNKPAFILGESRLGVTSIIGEADPYFMAINAPTLISYVGIDWEGKTYADLVQSTANTAYGFFMLNREGQFWFTGRGIMNSGSTVYSALDMGLHANTSQYIFGDNVVSNVDVTYNGSYHGPADILPEEVYVDDTENGTDGRPTVYDEYPMYWTKMKKLQPGDILVIKKEIKKLGVYTPSTATWPYPTGGQPTLGEWSNGWLILPLPEDTVYYDYDPDRMFIISIYDVLNNPVATGGSLPGNPEANDLSSVGGFRVQALTNNTGFSLQNWRITRKNKLRIRIQEDFNATHADPRVGLQAVRGLVTILDEAKTYTLTTGLSSTKAAKSRSVKTFLKNVSEAATLATRIINESGAYGEITSFTLYDRDQTWHERQLNHAIGNVVEITESQTGLTDVPHLIVGERFDWSPQSLKAQFFTTNISRIPA